MKMILTFNIPPVEYFNDALCWEITEDELYEHLSTWSYDELVLFFGEPEITFEASKDKH